MAWETRPKTKRSYYYKSCREGGRVVKKYLGSGKAAAEAAREVVERQVARQADAEAVQSARTALADVVGQMVELDEQMDLLIDAALLVSGCHKHKGEWRRRHGCRNSSPRRPGDSDESD